MSKSTDDYEQAIATYRAQLRAEAELADGDLDEIEDHLRSLTDELRGRGLPVAEAVTEAARRLGEPREVAREHNRVRSAFGARLSKARTWSLVALLVPQLVYAAIVMIPHVGFWHHFVFEYLAGAFLCGALVMRMGWARPILLGGLAFFMIPQTVSVWAFDVSPTYLVWHLGMLAFLVPWRRNELTPSGLALAAYVFAYGAASWTLSFQMTTPDGEHAYFAPTAIVACGGAALATVGAVLRARWSTIAGVASAVAIGVALVDLLGVDFRFPEHATLLEVSMIGSLAAGAMAALAGSVLAWRTARSSFGTLRAVRS